MNKRALKPLRLRKPNIEVLLSAPAYGGVYGLSGISGA
jgi:hypothetical protein